MVPPGLNVRLVVRQVSELADPDIEVLLVGNKVDVAENDRVVSVEEAKELAAKVRAFLPLTPGSSSGLSG